MRQALNDLRYRLRALFRRDAMDHELEAELQFHLDKEADKHVRAGLSPDEARRRARASFGAREGVKDDTRDVRGLVALETLVQDVRYAARGLTARPVFTAGIVLTLGLGLGANAAMFGIVDRLLFRTPDDLRDPSTLHRVYTSFLADGEKRIDRNLAFPVYLDFARASRSIEAFSAFQTLQTAVGDGAETEQMRVTVASANYFPLFNARPIHGRFFNASDDSLPVGSPVVVLGYGFWRARYGGDPGVLGKTLRVGQTVRTIIGVAPEGFVGLNDQGVPAAWIPITSYAHERRGTAYPANYGWSWLELVARRRPGVSVAAAEADLTLAFHESWRREAVSQPGIGTPDSARAAVTLGPLQFNRGPQAGQDAQVARWILGVSLIVLLIACANVANLLLSRAVSRQREIAVRLALGVSRARLIRQLLTESFILAVAGGVTGLAFANWGSAALRSFYFTAEESVAVASDVRTLLFAGVATIVVALLTGLVPALQAGRGDLAGALKVGSREGTYRRGRARVVLLVFQATLSVVLLVGAGLFVRSLRNVQGFRLGYDADRIVFAGANLRGTRLNPGDLNALNERMARAAREIPGVTHVSLAESVPFYSNESRGLWVPGVDSIRRRGRFVLQAGGPDYFATLGTRILRGRAFDESDRAGSPRVVVVSDGMARALWENADPIGKCIRISADTAPCTTVIGVAEEVRLRTLTDAREYTYYLPATQYGSPVSPQLFVRIQGEAADFVDPIRRRLQREMPGSAFAAAMPLDRLIDPARRSWKFGATMFVAFGGLALVLAAIGLYSLIAYDVAQRTQELGVRLALGASMGDVVKLVMSSGVRLVVVGLVLGGGLALWGSRWMESMMFQQSPRDPVVFGIVTLVLLAVALLASFGPALRAARVDPNTALRSD
ncbi:MAG TPA: ABC transporter permease [Gemmatimonadaceae bacterium]|nr:ABC transporter permease [Gemmatimonadaceae bacterium]